MTTKTATYSPDDNAKIALAAFPHSFGVICGMNYTAEEKRQQFSKMAREAGKYGWRILHKEAFLPESRRSGFYKAVGLA